MAEIQKVGTQQALKDGPRNSDPMRGNPGGTMQIGSTDIPQMKLKPTPDQFLNKGISGGTMQIGGTGVKLDSTPHRGLQSHPTPMSKQTESQSVGSRPLPSVPVNKK